LTITFLEQPSFHSLNTCEDKWIDKRNAHVIKHDPSSCETITVLQYLRCSM